MRGRARSGCWREGGRGVRSLRLLREGTSACLSFFRRFRARGSGARGRLSGTPLARTGRRLINPRARSIQRAAGPRPPSTETRAVPRLEGSARALALLFSPRALGLFDTACGFLGFGGGLGSMRGTALSTTSEFRFIGCEGAPRRLLLASRRRPRVRPPPRRGRALSRRLLPFGCRRLLGGTCPHHRLWIGG